MTGLTERAKEFAAHYHGNQLRKYTLDPYITHPIAVAANVQQLPYATDHMVAAALLHDVVEDTPCTLGKLYKEFGAAVGFYVEMLSEVSVFADGNREVRKSIERQRLAIAPVEVQTIKLFDIMDNVESIIQHDPKFAEVFVNEVKLILLTLDKVERNLMYAARLQLDKY